MIDLFTTLRKKCLWAVVAIALLAGCGPIDSPSPLSPRHPVLIGLNKSGPGSQNSLACDSATVANSDFLLVRKREDEEEGITIAVIGPAGGTLVHADHQVIVPPGALLQPVTITFEMPVSDTLLFELGPDGIQFLQPIQVILNYDHACKDDLDESLFGAVYYNPATGSWVPVSSSVDTELNTVNVSTTHFSRYALTKS